MLPKGFYAYASGNDIVARRIKEFQISINTSEMINISTWEDLRVDGIKINDEILRAIDQCDLFICDLTFINDNVLYELGYALAKQKNIWITIDRDLKDNIGIISAIRTIGYSEYSSSDEMVEKFYRELPHQKIKSINKYMDRVESKLLYLKPSDKSGLTSRITELIKRSQIESWIYDPEESVIDLSELFKTIEHSLGVILNFTSNNDSSSGFLSFSAGIALGLKKPHLLIADNKYEAPMDFRDRMSYISKSEKVDTLLKQFLEPIVEVHAQKQSEYKEFTEKIKSVNHLATINFGDYIAENESKDLASYFFETAEYKHALNNQQLLFIGRKGTGKTANLLKLREDLKKRKENFVITIQPEGFEFEALIDVIKQFEIKSEQTAFLENIWKYLIYTEIAKQLGVEINSKPLHIPLTREEEIFKNYYEKNIELIDADFTLRLENIVSKTKDLSLNHDLQSLREKLNEIIHHDTINVLRKLLGDTLKDKSMVKILVDNLDKGWDKEITRTSEILISLLNISPKIAEEFKRNTYKHNPLNVSLIVFLRSDIYKKLSSIVIESDKLPGKILDWSNSELLYKVIEKRIEFSTSTITNPEDFWGNYVCSQINGQPLKKYINKLIIPRPRDIIYLFQSALSEALNQEHTFITSEDFVNAEKKYSEYAIKSLLPENGGRIKNLEDILYCFVAEKSILNSDNICELLKEVTSHPHEDIIEVLCDLTFLGKEVRSNEFEFYSDSKNNKIIDISAKKFSQRNNLAPRYKIHNAFHSYLEVQTI
ncbi:MULTISPECIES: P-loop ATPase, Sll1717 family [Exiguobacterium]|uniref:P-loop ATPase, Sll1717 family n=1 Tax=Exiguobacterium TaxID=33986 RepID=UPI001BEBD3E4|nr:MULTISPECIES: hypothetical protein [unclassified Exiguobacterium]